MVFNPAKRKMEPVKTVGTEISYDEEALTQVRDIIKPVAKRLTDLSVFFLPPKVNKDSIILSFNLISRRF